MVELVRAHALAILFVLYWLSDGYHRFGSFLIISNSIVTAPSSILKSRIGNLFQLVVTILFLRFLFRILWRIWWVA